MKFILCTLIPVTLLLTSCSNPLFSQDLIPVHETFTIESALVGETRTINVWTPLQASSNATPLPVLYMLDGGIQEDFSHIANTIAELIASKKIKPCILVGIENTQRRRDLTGETSIEKDKEIAPIVGGSANFRAFIQAELFPVINKKYKTTEKKGIIGESLAGLFVVETLLLQPEMFDYYIAFDPSLWWNDKYLLKISDEKLGKFPTTPKVFWFTASGVKDIYKNVSQLATTLKAKNISNLKWVYAPAPKETHNTIFRATKDKAIIWALQ